MRWTDHPKKKCPPLASKGRSELHSTVAIDKPAEVVNGLIRETLGKLKHTKVEMSLTHDSYERIVRAGFNRATLHVAFALTQLALELHPITVRGLMYRAQAAGLFPNTRDKYYKLTCRVILKLRRAGIIPYSWIVDSTRRRLKPSSWAGIGDFADTAAEAYRKDLWSRQRDYVEIFVEKDAMAGILEPVTNEFDVHLNIIRGQVSETFVWNIAEEWNEIEKPIFAYYLGDHDPAGLSIEASIKSKLEGFCTHHFQWQRLAITAEDFADNSLLGFPVKRKGELKANLRAYIAEFGDRCVEVDAIDPRVIRDRVKQAIEEHIDLNEWQRIQEIEQGERETVRNVCVAMAGGRNS